MKYNSFPFFTYPNWNIFRHNDKPCWGNITWVKAVTFNILGYVNRLKLGN